MTVRTLSALVLAAGACLTNPLRAKEPDRPQAPTPAAATAQGNQQLADSVAARLRASGVATGADVNVTTQKGLVQLSGQVRSSGQRDAIVKAVLSVPGVTTVQHTIEVAGAVQPAQAVAAGEPAPLILPGTPGAAPGPFGPGGPPMTNDPVPLASPAMPAYDPHGPQMPPYAWPTYAPYNNVSRVGYPEAYPYNAWPYIGPFYPFPRVPLGWRSVQLQWEDGHWYYGRIATPHDYWRVRYW